ncbi:MAG: hypothetical protein NZM33_17360 [Bryobacteraceae bacterium]|nr:hypothetical protein [Bryobacteraceae bacterium]
MPNAETELEPLAMHQTVFVPPSRLQPLFILSVPKHDVTDGSEPTWDTLADLLDSAGPPMTRERWAEIARRVELGRLEVTQWLEESLYFWPPWRHHPRYREWYREEIQGLMSRLGDHMESPQFARGLLEGLLSRPSSPLQPVLRGCPMPWPSWLSPASALAEVVFAERRRLELSEEEAATWALITSVLAAEKNQQVRSTVEAISDFDVPFALSRRSDKMTLSTILSEARMVAFIPIARGAVMAAHHIIQGNYVVALEIAAVSGAASVILAGSYSLAEQLLRLGRQTRRRRM